MRETVLTAERLREVLEYEPCFGIFRWKKLTSNKAARTKVGKVAGWLNPASRYWIICVDQRLFPAHRLAFLYVTGDWPQGEIDHVDGNRSNNRIENLRDVTKVVNRQNLRVGHADGSGNGILGVSWTKHAKKWRASISVGGRNIHLGYRHTKEEAHQLYIQAKRKHHSGCTI